ncbi:MAG: YhjD/YihY/BrkB family envelope integrity protein, partial [Pirellulales bacterium]
ALDHVFHNKAQPPKRQAWITAILGRLLAALFVLGTGGLLVVMLLGTLALHWLENWLVQNTSFGGTGWQLTGGATSVVVTYVVFVAFLKLLPSNRPPLANVLPAAVIAVILFEMGRWLIGLYISHSVIATAYGPSSSIVAIVLWVFWTAQILLVAAEICAWSLDRRIKT